MPATLVLVTALLDWLPAAVGRLGGHGVVLRAAALALIFCGAATYLSIQHHMIRRKRFEVAAGSADSFRSDPRARFVNEALLHISRRAGAGETLAVLPEGVMLNYLCRRQNPTRYINFMPPEMILFGERRIIAAFEGRPPDWIALVPKDTSEYGPRFFGKDYGRELFEWIKRNYRPPDRIDLRPLQDNRLGILLLSRIKAPAGQPGPRAIKTAGQ
jgi:hypothetical protein